MPSVNYGKPLQNKETNPKKIRDRVSDNDIYLNALGLCICREVDQLINCTNIIDKIH